MHEPQAVARSSGVVYRSGSPPSVRRTERDVERAVHHEHGRAVVAAARVNAAGYVTRTALLNAALLSREEEQLIQLAPQGEFRYRAILEAYTMVAVNIVGGM
ncbi:hypothetical protein RB614_00930 [Phytohabitans sp. ZYX-F-186]|uniref:Uncharacterized protein n=1 Tax=Phytohabitans maris TaxID=3071409 RepID=A0ABU0Z9E4_9ACTN|nr:hypothetical protein [Phytohabitans sp. ZYX-F-186]MDQ7903084.1 hypothetical protein [Phytohabitans sp. ZYX-F-186]